MPCGSSGQLSVSLCVHRRVTRLHSKDKANIKQIIIEQTGTTNVKPLFDITPSYITAFDCAFNTSVVSYGFDTPDGRGWNM